MSSIDKAIGVFDSGLGGISVLKELRSLMPQEDYLYYGDSSFAPYGVKTKDFPAMGLWADWIAFRNPITNKKHKIFDQPNPMYEPFKK